MEWCTVVEATKPSRLEADTYDESAPTFRTSTSLATRLLPPSHTSTPLSAPISPLSHHPASRGRRAQSGQPTAIIILVRNQTIVVLARYYFHSKETNAEMNGRAHRVYPPQSRPTPELMHPFLQSCLTTPASPACNARSILPIHYCHPPFTQIPSHPRPPAVRLRPVSTTDEPRCR